MWRHQNVICTLTIIFLVVPTNTLITHQRSYSKLSSNYKLPVSFPKTIKCDQHLNLIKCAIMCQEMSTCYMLCHKPGMCAMAIIGNGYKIFSRDFNDECIVDESITYTCFNNEKMQNASAEERILALDVSNVALLKPTKVQQEYVASANSSPFLVDGNLDRTYSGQPKLCVDGNPDKLPWVWIDLQAKYDVLAINITNNDDGTYKKRFHDAEIRVGMNGDTSSDSITSFLKNVICFEYTGIGDDYWLDFCHPGPIRGKYVTLQIIKKCDPPSKCTTDLDNIINICEMQVFVLNA